jgi:tyrosyl-tRNA synthetase
MATLYDELEWRGLIAQSTTEDLADRLEAESMTLYAGFDPTANSLQIGNLLPVMCMAHFQRAGHRPIVLVGGATGMIGDPSGKSEERKLLSADQIQANAEAVKTQLSRFLDFEGDNAAIMVDNLDWIGQMSFIDWLRDVGKYFNVNTMLAKDSVKSRLGSDGGISYTEFSYMTLQAYDFLHLNDSYGCTLQVGGSDQWGNIVAGIELVRRRHGRSVFGLTFPLITTASGEKVGKSAGNALWLDAEETSPYRFYQYWIQMEDADVGRFLNYFTFLSQEEIAGIVNDHEAEPHRRDGQKRLAAEVTRLVHGEAGLKRALKATSAFFSGDVSGFSEAELEEVFADAPSSEQSRDRLGTDRLVDILADAAIFASRGEARRMIKGGGLSVNNCKVTDPEAVSATSMLTSDSIMVVRRGRKKYHLLRFV